MQFLIQLWRVPVVVRVFRCYFLIGRRPPERIREYARATGVAIGRCGKALQIAERRDRCALAESLQPGRGCVRLDYIFAGGGAIALMGRSAM